MSYIHIHTYTYTHTHTPQTLHRVCRRSFLFIMERIHIKERVRGGRGCKHTHTHTPTHTHTHPPPDQMLARLAGVHRFSAAAERYAFHLRVPEEAQGFARECFDVEGPVQVLVLAGCVWRDTRLTHVSLTSHSFPARIGLALRYKVMGTHAHTHSHTHAHAPTHPHTPTPPPPLPRFLERSACACNRRVAASSGRG